MELFDAQPQIEAWFPDETLFSLSSRYHRFLGHRRHDETCQTLFGHPRQGSAHDFPARLSTFEDRTRGALGSAIDIILQRTLLPFYFPFRSPLDADNALAAAQECGLGHLKASLGMLASRFGASHPLKACPHCIVEDQRVFGVAFWRRDHQWPATWICTTHDCILERALAKVNSQGRFQWLLPDDVDFAPPGSAADLECAKPTLRELSRAAIRLGRLPAGTHFDPSHLVEVYRRRLQSLALMNASFRLDTHEFEALLDRTLGPLASVHGLQTLSGRETSLAIQFSRLFVGGCGSANPLRHLLLSMALFGTWSDFDAAYRLQQVGPGALPEDTSNTQPDDEIQASTRDRRWSLVRAVAAGDSVSAAAKTAGVAVATAMCWVAAAGLSTPRRPKKLRPELRDLAIRRLRAGGAKEAVASAIGMSIQSVTMLLRSEPGLAIAWHEARNQKAMRIAREKWRRTAERLASPSPAAMRSLQPAVFAWLYRNDRAWLQSFAQTLPSLPRSNNATIKWDARDAALSAAIRSTALELTNDRLGSSVRLADLCNSIDELKGRLSSLDRLPMTRTAIAEVTRRASKRSTAGEPELPGHSPTPNPVQRP